MWGNLTYLFLMFIFAGIPVVVEFIFGYFLFKKYTKSTIISVLIFVIITPFIEKAALMLKAWDYNPQKYIGIVIISSPLETIIFAILTGLAVALAVTAWSFYEDNGKPIFRTSVYDVFHGTYAIWKRKTLLQKAKPAEIKRQKESEDNRI